MKSLGLERFLIGLGETSFKFIQDKRPRVATSGGANFPEVFFRQLFEMGSRSPEFRPVKDRLSSLKLLQNSLELRRSR